MSGRHGCPRRNAFSMCRRRDDVRRELRRRESGNLHLCRHDRAMPNGELYGVDHGICFAAEPKLRTILWDWRGDPIASEELEVLRSLRAQLDGSLCDALERLIAPAELRALTARVDRLIRTKVFPQPDPYRMAVPWPPF